MFVVQVSHLMDNNGRGPLQKPLKPLTGAGVGPLHSHINVTSASQVAGDIKSKESQVV